MEHRMALSKSIATPAGVAATYWTITSCARDFVGQALRFTIAGFLDQAASDGGKAALSAQDFTLGPADFGGKAMDTLTLVDLYAYAKAQAMFAGATDL
jgi:hypothetical protein